MSDEDALARQIARFSRKLYTPYDERTGEGLERADPTPATLVVEDGTVRVEPSPELDDYFAPGRAAVHPIGVLFRGDHETLEDGMCRQARMHARALSRTGIPVMLTSISQTVRHGIAVHRGAGDDILHPTVLEEVQALRRTSISRPLCAIYHTTIRGLEQLRSLMLPEYARAGIGVADRIYAHSIVYTPWERSTLDSEIAKLLNRCGQVWVQCHRNMLVFAHAGVSRDKLRLMPNGFDDTSAICRVPDTHPRVTGRRRFYNIGKWEPRKAQHELIGGFLTAFGPADKASLTIKTMAFGAWKDYPTPLESVRHWLEQQEVRDKGWSAELAERHLVIFDRVFSDDELIELHARNNVYVSAGRAEGWDYPAFDAKLAGNALVYVGYGGPEDFAAPSDRRVAWTELEPVHPGYGWESTARWARVDAAMLGMAMQKVIVQRTRRRPDALIDLYGWRATGERMRRYVLEVLSGEPADHAALEALCTSTSS